jgi:hypothetical protein
VFISKWLKSLTYYFTLTKAALGKYKSVIVSLLIPISTFAQPHTLGQFFENGRGTHRGPDAGMFADTPFRHKIDLAGAWQYTLDGTTWNSTTVPGAYDFSGKVKFQRTFELSSELLDKYVLTLVVYGINYQSEIAINGTFLTRHFGGYSSFNVPIEEHILQGGNENIITIMVDNMLTARTTLPLRQRVGGWRSYGGILRDIYLLATPKLFIGETEVQYDLSSEYKTAKVRVHSVIENRRPQPDTLIVTRGSYIGFIAELYNKLTDALVTRSAPIRLDLSNSRLTTVTAELNVASPKLWSPSSPDLYVLKCHVVQVKGREINPLDEFDLNIGLRDLRLKESSITLNGSRLTMKGVVWHEDHPVFGAALTYEAMEKDIAQIKGLGANLVRFLYPPHPYVLNLCDRYGLLAMEEIPFVGVPNEVMQNEEYQELTVNYLKEMVLRDRHHVSIFAWGIGDEFDSQWNDQRYCGLLTSMRDVVVSLDNRPTFYAGSTFEDACLDGFPLLVVNTYSRQPKDFRQLVIGWQERFPSKPILIGRYGKDVQPWNRNGYSDPLSLEAQARHAMQHYEVAKDLKLAGSIWWSFNDWRGDRPSLSTSSGDPYLHTSGLVSYEREKRVAYDVLRAAFNSEKIAALPIGNFSSNTPMVYVIAGLAVLIAFAFLYNSNRRFRENVHRGLSRTYNFFADVRDQRILSHAHSLFLALVIAVTWATVLSSILSHYRDSLLLDNILSQVMPDAIKEWLVLLVWDPTDFVLVATGLIFGLFIFLSLLVQLSSYIVRARTTFYHSTAVAIWSMLPYIILIPVAMILHRILETPIYILPSFILIGVLVIWTMYRFLKGISVIFDVYPLKVYAAGIIIIVGGIALLYGYLDYVQSASIYLKHLLGAVSIVPSGMHTISLYQWS